MRLYYSPGSSSLASHITLIDAGLSFDAVRVDEHTKVMEDGGDYRQVHWLGYVPALLLIATTSVLFAPVMAQAQGASIAGVVKDTSGAVLPGVTVEAASPVLIEKVRVAVTDAGGVFRIENLFPGTYTVTFTLPGFNTVKREGLELPGNFTATVNAELRIGALEETVTVSGASPVVDVQPSRATVS